MKMLNGTVSRFCNSSISCIIRTYSLIDLPNLLVCGYYGHLVFLTQQNQMLLVANTGIRSTEWRLNTAI